MEAYHQPWHLYICQYTNRSTDFNLYTALSVYVFNKDVHLMPEEK